jgi:hypothetical protein
MIEKNSIRLYTACLIGTLLGIFGLLSSVSAQWSVGVDLVVAVPSGDFADVTETGTGLGLSGQYRLRSFPHISLKADAAFITYRYEPYSGPGYVLETRTQSIRVAIGPQFSVKHRRTELYLSPKFGFYYFYTHDDIFDVYGFWLTGARNNNTEFGWNMTGGVVIDIAHMPRKSFDLALHVGGSWHSVSKGFKTEIDADGDPIDVLFDVEEFCIHAGLVFHFR